MSIKLKNIGEKYVWKNDFLNYPVVMVNVIVKKLFKSL